MTIQRFKKMQCHSNLTKAMKSQLLEYFRDIEESCMYWKNTHQFWKRHDKIVKWVREQEGK